jgi:hypothetical protein
MLTTGEKLNISSCFFMFIWNKADKRKKNQI